MLLFAVHIAVLINTILNIIDDCIEGGIGMPFYYYSHSLWFFILFYV